MTRLYKAVLYRLCNGEQAKDIAREMDKSENYVKKITSDLRAHFGVNTTAKLIVAFWQLRCKKLEEERNESQKLVEAACTNATSTGNIAPKQINIDTDLYH